MLKSQAESEQHTSGQERQDSMALKKRAADGARNDADEFASKTHPQDNKTVGPTGFEPVAELFCAKRKRAGAGSPDGIDGLLIHSVGATALGELLKIFLAAQSMRIFHDNLSWTGIHIYLINQVLSFHRCGVRQSLHRCHYFHIDPERVHNYIRIQSSYRPAMGEIC
jgi:hypothetical protein